eukprot:SAG11_NODE_34107_length_273_cov_5.218391_1_plen_51_part_10
MMMMMMLEVAAAAMPRLPLLRWSCNARDVHLLRGTPRRLVHEAALRHDRAV